MSGGRVGHLDRASRGGPADPAIDAAILQVQDDMDLQNNPAVGGGWPPTGWKCRSQYRHPLTLIWPVPVWPVPAA